MAAPDSKVLIRIGFLGQLGNARTTDVVLATGRNQDVVEVAQADWAVVLELLSVFDALGICSNWKVVSVFYLVFFEFRIETHFVSIPHFLFD